MRFEPLFYVPVFTQKDFHYVHTGPPTQGTSTEKFTNTNLGVQYSSLQHNHLYTRGRAQIQNNNHLYTRGITTNPKLNHLYTRGIGTKPKQRKDYNSL